MYMYLGVARTLVFALQKSVSIAEVVRILTRAKQQAHDADKIITHPPKKLKTGEMYLFQATDQAKQGN